MITVSCAGGSDVGAACPGRKVNEVNNHSEFLKRVRAVLKHRAEMDPVMCLEFVEEFQTWVDGVRAELCERLVKEEVSGE